MDIGKLGSSHSPIIAFWGTDDFKMERGRATASIVSACTAKDHNGHVPWWQSIFLESSPKEMSSNLGFRVGNPKVQRYEKQGG